MELCFALDSLNARSPELAGGHNSTLVCCALPEQYPASLYLATPSGHVHPRRWFASRAPAERGWQVALASCNRRARNHDELPLAGCNSIPRLLDK